MNWFDLRKKLSFKGDRILWYVIIGLMLASVMVVYSSTGSLAYRVRSGNTSYFLIKQVILMSGCLVVILTLQSIHYKYFLSFAKIVLGMSFIFLLWAKFAGTTLNDAGRWVTIPGIGFTFQPSEMAKLGVIMYCARVIAFYQNERCCDDEALKKILFVAGPVIFLIFLDNFSTSLLMGLVCLAMLFVGRLRLKLIAMSVGALVATIVVLLVLAFTVPKVAEIGRIATVKSRIVNFFNPESVNSDDSYQSDQAKIAVAKGGLVGLGPGNSVQRNFLPHPYSDFIFAIIIEEYGLLGAGVVMLLYLIILYRIGVIVRRCTRTFPAILVTGLGLSIVFQALVNMGVCVGLMPVTGQPLPLMSMGGTSLIFTSAAFGMILSVSHTFSEEGEREEREKQRIKSEKLRKRAKDIEEDIEEEYGEREPVYQNE
ncbi:FtsW/RodA/SpoVE family cell cycle protein [Gabonibacter chumensis]|uniref:FtsW/RodA/SpoVE family cell cycle protein n=1 Tax=Gabonibacter chumensis TaxID=2972474 RepID=UPI002572309B|nr:FtsW/RodA/SpoVE family cell cycle protein [Gabonibacter chumensis]MCR9011994.1 FtsW/RodA/SpoVE family cell cycle protein [Gabonibacter chumensis]